MATLHIPKATAHQKPWGGSCLGEGRNTWGGGGAGFSISLVGRKGKSHLSAEAGGFQEDGGRSQVATGKVRMPHIRNKAGSLPNPALWLQRLGEDSHSEQCSVQGGGELMKDNKGSQDMK